MATAAQLDASDNLLVLMAQIQQVDFGGDWPPDAAELLWRRAERSAAAEDKELFRLAKLADCWWYENPNTHQMRTCALDDWRWHMGNVGPVP